MLAAIPFPEWIRPEILPGLPFRWYGLMYVAAFAITYALFRVQARRSSPGISPDDSLSFFSWGILGLLLGARLFGALLYNGSGPEVRINYWQKPWLIFWPFDDKWNFTGFMGMSYHGGLVGLVAGTLIYCKARKKDFLEWWDLTAAAVPLGYTLGRVGNFINGELYGRVTDGPLGMIFPDAGRFPASDDWVRRMAEASGVTVSSMNAMVNLPRFPSQLLEALFEGLLLWALLWFVLRPRKPFKGFIFGVYLVGYGLVRFVLEYFRAPDEQLGYVINLSGKDLSGPEAIARFTTPAAFSMGQVLCLLMAAAGGTLLWFLARADREDRAVAGLAAGKPPRKGMDRKAQKRIR